jgi:hypothetical protein
MSGEIITIGPVPTEERCAQVGQPDYSERSLLENMVFERMLKRTFPLTADVQAQFTIKSSRHDFGSYRDVCIRFDSTDERAVEYAYHVEANTPAKWDAIATYELIWYGRKAEFDRALRRGEIEVDDIPEAYRKELSDLPVDLSFSELMAAFPM